MDKSLTNLKTLIFLKTENIIFALKFSTSPKLQPWSKYLFPFKLSASLSHNKILSLLWLSYSFPPFNVKEHLFYRQRVKCWTIELKQFHEKGKYTSNCNNLVCDKEEVSRCCPWYINVFPFLTDGMTPKPWREYICN